MIQDTLYSYLYPPLRFSCEESVDSFPVNSQQQAWNDALKGETSPASCGVRPPNTAVSVATVQQQEWECGVDRGVAFDSGRENEELGC